MPKSWYKLNLFSSKTFNNFSEFVTNYRNSTENFDEILSDFCEKGLHNNYYHDFNGWEYITYHVNTNFPFLLTCMYLLHINKVKYKLARYQMRELCMIYKIQIDV